MRLPKEARRLLALARTHLADIEAHEEELEGSPTTQFEVEQIRDDYLPTALALYRDTPSDLREERDATGATPADEVETQLAIIVDRLAAIRVLAHQGKRRRSAAHTAFLRDRLRRRPSDLDLTPTDVEPKRSRRKRR